MSRQIAKADSRTREIIDDLFAHPPVNDAELRQRIEDVNATAARRLVVDQLDRSRLPERAGPLFLALMAQIGIGRQKGHLTRIALDLSRDSRERLWAAMALTSEDPKAMDYLVDELGPNGMGILAELSLFELLTMQDAADMGTSIATALENLLDDRPADELLRRIESCRQGIGVSCTTAYGESLRAPDLREVRGRILDLFVQEASEEGVEFLMGLRDHAEDDDTRRDFQGALLKLRSRRIDPSCPREEIPGYALVSNCDGQGDYILLAVFENTDETLTVADLCLRAGGDVRDGVVYPRRRSREIEDILSDVQRQLGCFFIEVTLGEAANLVQEAVKRTGELEQPLPAEASQAISLFDRVERAFRWGDGSCCPPAKGLHIEQIRSLLERSEYDDTWFFDVGDLGGKDVVPPAEGEALDSWAEKLAPRLESPTVRGRLVAMSEHMARWHHWNDEHETAALCRAIAGSVRQSVADSGLAKIMLERSAETIQHAVTELTHQFGDPSARQYYKMRFFYDLSVPKGRDLARLDLTEASAAALNAAFDMLPGDRRPRDEERDTAAYSLGRLFADHVIANGDQRPEKTVAQMSRALASACRLTEKERHQVLMAVMQSLYAFVDEICAVCPVDCLKRPEDDVSEVFFTPEHPVSTQFVLSDQHAD